MDNDQSTPAEESAENPYASPNVDERPVVKPVSILAIIGISIAVIFSSGIAFCCTCIPIGAMSFNLHGPSRWYSTLLAYVAWGGGLFVGGLVGYAVARGLWRLYRPSNETPGEPEA